MFATQIILLAATAVAPLASNAAPILSGMFSKSTIASRQDTTTSTSNDTNVQLAQGTNFFFSTLHLEDQCTPGQVACIGGNLASCSGEANWEVSPCANNTSCFAVPNADNTNIDVKCIAESDATALIAQDGGQGGASVDFGVTAAPFPNPTDSTATPTGTDGGNSTAIATTTDDGTPTSTESCTPDDGSDDGSNDGSDDGSNDGSTDGSNQTVNGTLADAPTPTANATDVPTPTGTGTDNCSADVPEETETITLVLVPNPTESGVFETETYTGGDLPAATDGPFTDAPANATDSFGVGPGDVPTPTATTGVNGTDAATDIPTPTESCTSTDGGDSGNGGNTDGSADGGYTDGPSDGPAPTDSGADSTTSRTTLTVPPALASPTATAGSNNNGGVNVIGTHNIPANSAKRSIVASRFFKVRRS